MLCTKCGKNEATVYFSQTINGNKTEYNLCPDCAREMNLTDTFAKHRHYIQNNFFSPVGAFGFPFEKFFGSSLFSDPFFDLLPVSEYSCNNTALSDKEAQVSESRAQSVQAPAEDKLTKLRRELDDAVKAERYEDAAKFRDQIRALEK